MRVSIFKNILAIKPQETELDKIAYMMCHSKELFLRTKAYRLSLAIGQKDLAKQLKVTRFPAFAPCALLYDGKARDHVVGLSDLCFLDIDHIMDKQQITATLELLRQDEHVVMASKSLSGNGLHILIRYRIRRIDMPPQRVNMGPFAMQKRYKKVFECVSKIYQEKLGVPIDPQAGNIERLFLISFAPGLHYNPTAEPLIIDL